MKKKIDLLLLLPYIFISFVGLVMIYSASSYRLMILGESTFLLLKRQIIFIVISWLVVFSTYKLRENFLLKRSFTKKLLVFSLLCLIITKIQGININGAQRWVSILGIQFQPSELTNVGLIFFFASFFHKKRNRNATVFAFLIVSFSGAMILIQPKITGTIILLAISLLMITTVQGSYRMVTLSFLLIFLCFFLTGKLILFLGDQNYLPKIFAYTYDRIHLLKDPFIDPYGNGFQMSNSYYALYNGGLFGRGLGNSITKKGFLPVTETDFIFSIMVEELGLLFSLLVLGALFLIPLRLFVLAAKEINQQISLIYLGVGGLLLLQICINISSILGFIPMTGVPLPFISYGGTNYLVLSIALGTCLKLSSEDRKIV